MQTSQKPRRIRFKCRFDGDTRTVTVTPETEFSELRKRLSSDYGFDVSMKYEDKDGDMIILASQNDLDDLFMHDEAETINVMISETLSLPNLHLKGSMSNSRLGTATNNNIMSLYNTSSVVSSAVQSNPTGLLNSARDWSKVQNNASVSDASSMSSFTATSQNTNTLNHSLNNRNTASILRPVPTSSASTRVDRFPTINPDHHAHKHEIFNIRWKKGEMLGQGAFGVVYLGLNIDSGELMAVKMMATEDVSKRELASLENEIKLLRSLRHPNIVRYIGTELNPECMSIFLEYVPGGSLKALIDKFGHLEESVAKSYTRQLLIGLEYLHRHGIAHRDIKGANCLVGNDGVIKLADFGNSKHWRPVGGTAGGGGSVGVSGVSGSTGAASAPSGDIKGTPSWMAPEVIRDEGGNISWRKADIWSLACTTLEMTTGKAPWKQFNNPVTILYHIACQDTLPEYPSPASFELITFLNTCLQRDPKLRPDITSLLLHPFVSHMILPSSISNNNYTNSNSGGMYGNSSSVYGNRPSTVSHAVVGEWDRAPSMFYNTTDTSNATNTSSINTSINTNSVANPTTALPVNTNIQSSASGIDSPFPAEDPELALEVDHTTHMSSILTPLQNVASDYVDSSSATPINTHHTSTLYTTLEAEPTETTSPRITNNAISSATINNTGTTPINTSTQSTPQSTPTTTYTKSIYPSRLAALTHTTSSPNSARTHKRRVHKNNTTSTNNTSNTTNTGASSAISVNNSTSVISGGMSSPSSRVNSAVKSINSTSSKRNKKHNTNTTSPTHITHSYARDLDSPLTIHDTTHHTTHNPYTTMHNIHGDVIDSTSAIGAMEAQLALLLHENTPKGAHFHKASLGGDYEAPTPIKMHSAMEDDIVKPPTTLRIPKLDIHYTIHTMHNTIDNSMPVSGEKADPYTTLHTHTNNMDSNANTNTTTPTKKASKGKKHRTNRTTFDSFDSDDNWQNDTNRGGSNGVTNISSVKHNVVNSVHDVVGAYPMDTNRSIGSIVLDTNRSVSILIVDPYEYNSEHNDTINDANNDSSVCIEADSMYDDTSIGYSSAEEPRIVSSGASNTSSIRGNVHHTVHSISYVDGNSGIGVAMSPTTNTTHTNTTTNTNNTTNATSSDTTSYTTTNTNNTTTTNTRGVIKSSKTITGPSAYKKLNLSRSQTELSDDLAIHNSNNIYTTNASYSTANASSSVTNGGNSSNKGTSVIKPTTLQTPSSGVRRRDITTANTTNTIHNTHTTPNTHNTTSASDSLDESNMLDGLFTYSTLSTNNTNSSSTMRNSNSRRSLDMTSSSRLGTRNSTARTSNRLNTATPNITSTNHTNNHTNNNANTDIDPLDISCDSLDTSKLHITGTSASTNRTNTINNNGDIREGTAKPNAGSTRQSRRVSTATINTTHTTNNNTTHSIKCAPDEAYLTRSLSTSIDHDDVEPTTYNNHTTPHINHTTYNTTYTSMFASPPALLHEHTAAVTHLRAPARTNLLLSSSLDGTVRVWSSNSSGDNSDGSDSGSGSKVVLEATGFKCDNVYGDKVERRIVMGSTITTNTTTNTTNNTNPTDNDAYTTHTARQPTIRINNLWADEYCDFIYAACSDACVRVWSGEGKSVRLLRGHEDSVTAMEGIDSSTSGVGSGSGMNGNSNGSSGTVSSGGGSMIATGSVDRTVRVWDVRAKKAQVFAFRGHGDTVLALRWGEGGRSLISSGKDKTVRIWDTRAGRLRATLEKHFGAVSCIRVLNNTTNTTATNNTSGSSANTYGSSIGSSINTNTNTSSGIDSACIVSAGRDSMLNVWSSSGDCVYSQTAHRGTVSFLSEINYNSGSNVYSSVLSSSISGGMGSYSSIYNAQMTLHSCANARAVYSAPFCANPLMISIGADSVIKLHDMRRFKCVSEINPHTNGSQCGLFTKAVWCNEGFIVSSNVGVVRLYEYGSIDAGSVSGKESTSHNMHSGYNDISDSMGRSGSHSPGTLPYPNTTTSTGNVYNIPATATTASEWIYRDIGVHTSTNSSSSTKDNTTSTGGGMNASTDLICTENMCVSASKSGQILRWSRQ